MPPSLKVLRGHPGNRVVTLDVLLGLGLGHVSVVSLTVELGAWHSGREAGAGGVSVQGRPALQVDVSGSRGSVPHSHICSRPSACAPFPLLFLTDSY